MRQLSTWVSVFALLSAALFNACGEPPAAEFGRYVGAGSGLEEYQDAFDLPDPREERITRRSTRAANRRARSRLLANRRDQNPSNRQQLSQRAAATDSCFDDSGYASAVASGTSLSVTQQSAEASFSNAIADASADCQGTFYLDGDHDSACNYSDTGIWECAVGEAWECECE